MPCDTIQRYQVELKAADRALLKRAIEGMGYTVRHAGDTLVFETGRGTAVITNQRIDVPAREFKLIDRVKRAYSELTIQEAAERFGWELEETRERQFALIRAENF